MKTRLLLLLFCLSSLFLFAQKGDEFTAAELAHQCGTPDISDEEFRKLPWVGDNDKLKRAIQEKEQILAQYFENRSSDCSYVFGGTDISNNPIVNVPVYFFVYKESGESGLPSVTEINAINDYTNTLLANSGSQMRLVIHCIRYPISSQYVEIENRSELDGMMQARRDEPGINIHVVRDGYGWAGVYNPSKDAIALKRSVVTNSTSETYAHEVGHFFTLPHTHKYTNLDPDNAAADGFNTPCLREPVSRNVVIDPWCNFPFPSPFPFAYSHCSWTGDGFCDTPADPNEGGCSYSENWVDWLGDPYAPDDDNIMSYYRCRSDFSPMQVAAMWNNLLSRLGGSWGDILNGDFVIADTYEPNNNADDATILALGGQQIHTLHDHCNRDEDWFVIEPGDVLGDYVINVERLLNCEWPVWDVDVMYENGSGNMVNFPGANVVEVNGTFVATIDCQDVNSNELFVRVNNLYMLRGYYKIYMQGSGNAAIQGPATFCNQAQYQVTGIPSGASVSWIASPGLSLSCQTCNPTTVQSAFSSGTFTLEATVTHNGCQITLEKQVTKNGGTVPPFGIVEIIPACYEPFGGFDGFGEYMIANASSGVTYNWSVSGGSAFPSTGTFSTVYVNGPGSFTITVVATGSCGAQRTLSSTFYAGPCEWRMQLNVSPNPAKDFLRVEIDDKAAGEGGLDKEYLIIVNDLYGKVWYQGNQGIKDFNLDISNYKEGVYNLRVVSGETSVSTNFVVSKD